ncbi:MAG TPA: butyrate kinase [Bacillota bacterium]|nr:butyrate kinase [Bacillota bacterium]
MNDPTLLVINPGSTSTKVAIFQGERIEASDTLRHDAAAIAAFPRIFDQFDMRRDAVYQFLADRSFPIEHLSAVIGRGGVLPPVEGGVYIVDDALVEALYEYGWNHASSLGGLIARDIAGAVGIPAYIADPVTTDELDDIARITGLQEIERRSVFHALNQKAVARRAASALGREYHECNLIVVHLGGGISVGGHRRGRVVEVSNALDGEGPYAPERSGSLPNTGVVRLCFSGAYTEREVRKKITGKGGLVAYLGTNSLLDVENRIAAGDEYARLCYEGMAYQVAKEIGRVACAMSGEVDAIVVTGGAANSTMLVGLIRDRVEFIARVLVYPGEEEMQALALAAMRVLAGIEQAKRIAPLTAGRKSHS